MSRARPWFGRDPSFVRRARADGAAAERARLAAAAPAEVDETRAVRTWGDAARVLGVSRRTVERARARHDPDRAPWFGSPAEVRVWWDRLGAPVPVRPRAARPTPTRHADLDAFDRARRGGR